jgi:hypothetical protein
MYAIGNRFSRTVVRSPYPKQISDRPMQLAELHRLGAELIWFSAVSPLL